MAYTEEDKSKEQDLNKQAQAINGQSGIVGGTGSQSALGGGNSGSSYQMPWANIQDYVSANKNTNGSAQNFSNAVSGAYNTEKSNFDAASSQAKSQGAAAAQVNAFNQANADKWVNDAGQNYMNPMALSFAGHLAGSSPVHQIAENYKNQKSQMQGNLGAQYAGPNSFNYSLGAEAQKYMNLGDDNQYQAIMNSIYGKSGVQGAGQFGLQQQLDVNNQALQQARNDWQSKYAALPDYEKQGVADTNSALQGNAQTVKDNAAKWKDALTKSKATQQSNMQKNVDDWNAAESAIVANKPGGSLMGAPIFHQGETADTSNVGGLDNIYRYNAILDALGMSGQMTYNQDEPKHSYWQNHYVY